MAAKFLHIILDDEVLIVVDTNLAETSTGINPLKLTDTTTFNVQKFYVLLSQFVCVCAHLKTNSDYFPIQHYMICFYNPDGVFSARYELNVSLNCIIQVSASPYRVN